MSEADRLIEAYDSPVAETARALRTLILGVDARIEEGVKWRSPSFHVGTHFATYHVRPGRPLVLVLHRDAKARLPPPERLPVPDAAGLLEWRANDRANVTLREAAEVDAHRDSLTATLRAWIDTL